VFAGVRSRRLDGTGTYAQQSRIRSYRFEHWERRGDGDHPERAGIETRGRRQFIAFPSRLIGSGGYGGYCWRPARRDAPIFADIGGY